jgi:hypothetical protein
MTAEEFRLECLLNSYIRLLEIKIGSTQHIALDCDVFALDEAPTFAALSYASNHQARTQQIELQENRS